MVSWFHVYVDGVWVGDLPGIWRGLNSRKLEVFVGNVVLLMDGFIGEMGGWVVGWFMDGRMAS